MGAAVYDPDAIFANELEEQLMKSTYHEDYTEDPFSVDQTEEVHRNSDVEVDITECTKSGRKELVEEDCANTTESSSSFDGSDSEVENGDNLGQSEAYASDLEFDIWFNNIGRTRNKKVTSHWRSFIQPLMWRCKWTEVQIQKLQAQALEYDKKLEKCSQQKQVQFDKSALENNGVKSTPFSSDYARNKVCRRKKRKRNEATTDIAAYMSHHNIFSYYEKRNFFTEGASLVDEPKNPEAGNDDQFWGNDEESYQETRDSDNFLQQLFQKMELLQSQVSKLRGRVDNLKSDIAGKLSCTDNSSLSIPSEGLIALCPDDEANMPLGSCIASHLVAEYKTGSVPVPQRAITSHEEVVADLNGSSNHIYFAGAYGNEEEDVLIDNPRVKEEMNNFDEVKIQPIQWPPMLKDKSGITNRPVAIEPEVPTNNERPPRLRTISKLNIPKSKTKLEKTKATRR